MEEAAVGAAACGFFFLTFFLGFCVVASARAWIKWAGGWDWTLSLPSSPRTIQGMKSCWKAPPLLPRGEEGVGLGGANVMSNSMGSEDEDEEERAQRRVRMGRKRGKKGLVLRKEAAKDIGDDATEAIFADGGWGE